MIALSSTSPQDPAGLDLGLGGGLYLEEGPGPYPDMSGAVVRLITGASSPLLGRPRHPARLCVRLSCGVPQTHSGVSNTGLLLATCLALLLGGSLRLSLK